VISTGSTNSSLAEPRTLFRDAIALGAASLILAHNHPSGDLTPSREDIALTRKLTEGGKLLDINIHDHIILGGDSAFVSLAERGILS
jgi:DNA repair protein RadC